MSIKKSLKKLAVRLIGEEESGIVGSDIAEVIGYTAENLNVDPSSGRLIVSEYVEPSQPSGGSGLLSEPVTLTASADGASAAQVPTLNLVLGKTYAITYTYKGEKFTAQRQALDANTGNNLGIERSVTLGNMAEDAILVDNGLGVFLVADKCLFSSETGPSYSADTCAIILAPLDLDAGGALDTLVVESITEV